jgi:hypothetical protein
VIMYSPGNQLFGSPMLGGGLQARNSCSVRVSAPHEGRFSPAKKGDN